MLTARGWFVWFRPEVGDPRDQFPGELEERHPVVGTAIEAPLEPHHPVLLVGDDDLGPQMPVTRIFLVELQVPVTAPDALPRLRYLVDHGGMQQRSPGVPVPGLQGCDEALHTLTVTAHPGK